MPQSVISFITQYGYFSVFIIIFSMEAGIPNPVPNELVLMFCGYLSIKGVLLLPILFLVAPCADFTGTSILYGIFYFLGKRILRHKPRWFPLSEDSIEKLSEKIAKGGKTKIYFYRLIPFVRGYTSIITGLLQMKPRIFLPIALLSGITWSTFYLITGRLLGPYCIVVGNKLGKAKYVVLLSALMVLIIVPLIRYLRNRAVVRSQKKA
jgi:membrane protein DedA with SNARE-associated domain